MAHNLSDMETYWNNPCTCKFDCNDPEFDGPSDGTCQHAYAWHAHGEGCERHPGRLTVEDDGSLTLESKVHILAVQVIPGGQPMFEFGALDLKAQITGLATLAHVGGDPKMREQCLDWIRAI